MIYLSQGKKAFLKIFNAAWFKAEKLQKQFNEKIIVNINELNGKTVYKVVVGAFENKTEAVHLFRRMEAAGVRGFPRNLADLG